MPRNLSVNRYFVEKSLSHVPKFRFGSGENLDWNQWRNALLPAARRTLLNMPVRVPLNAETLLEWEEEGLVKRRFVIDVEEGLSATGYLYRPKAPAGKLPALLICHGHGEWGKDLVMGRSSSAAITADIRSHNYDYGLQMAKAGFITIGIDWRGFGERDDRHSPHNNDLTGGRDQCNLHYLRATMLGMTVLGMNVNDAICALDYLCGQPDVDVERIGIMGLSYGGTMSVWTSLCDARIKAANVICYCDRFLEFAMRDANICGSQITPGLYQLCDVPDLLGLIAPRPLLVEIGLDDTCFRIDGAMNCYHEAEKIYHAAEAGSEISLDLFEGGHRWHGAKSIAFFERALRYPVSPKRFNMQQANLSFT